MLTTEDIDEIPMGTPEQNSGKTVWRAVSFELAIPYVFFTYSLKFESGWISNTQVLWREDDVLDFCLTFKEHSKRKILDVSLLLWHQRDGTPCRRMVRLSEIWSVRGQSIDEWRPIYICMKGQRVGLIDAVETGTAEIVDTGTAEIDGRLLYRCYRADGAQKSKI